MRGAIFPAAAACARTVSHRKRLLLMVGSGRFMNWLGFKVVANRFTVVEHAGRWEIPMVDSVLD